MLCVCGPDRMGNLFGHPHQPHESPHGGQNPRAIRGETVKICCQANPHLLLASRNGTLVRLVTCYFLSLWEKLDFPVSVLLCEPDPNQVDGLFSLSWNKTLISFLRKMVFFEEKCFRNFFPIGNLSKQTNFGHFKSFTDKEVKLLWKTDIFLQLCWGNVEDFDLPSIHNSPLPLTNIMDTDMILLFHLE